MAIVTLKQVKDHLNFTDDMGDIDDDLLTLKIQAAQNHCERLLGYKIETRYGGQDQEPVPPALHEAVCQLAAWWYEHREGNVTGTIVTELPNAFNDIIREYREWTF